MAYAVQLIDPDAPPFIHVLRRIAHEHVSLGIRPEQYTIAGHHLLSAVEEVLGDAVTPEIARAWDEVYWLIATQLVAEEARPSISPGQYVSVFVDLPDGERQPRQYTVSSTRGGTRMQITVLTCGRRTRRRAELAV